MLNTLGDILPRAARRFGARPALVVGERQLGFDELDVLSRRCASALVGLGVKPGDRVTLYAGNRWEWIVAYHGILEAGAVANPINVMLTPEEVAYVARDCGARVVIAAREKAEPLLPLRGAGGVEAIVTLGEPILDGARPFGQLLESGDPAFAPVPRAPEDISTIGYTSGTTGHPKGAMLTHRAVLLNTLMTAQMHARTERDVIVTGLPCAHVYGNVVMNGALALGAKLVLLERFDAGAALDAIEAHRATLFEGVPTMYMYMLDHPSLPGRELSSLTRCTVGGQTMPVAKMKAVEARFGCPLLELWGMTEIGGLGTTHPSLAPNRHGSIGVPLPFVECRIADPEDGSRALGPDQPGELLVRGPIVMTGYHGDEGATREVLRPDGWLHTGDIARMDPDGYVFVVDRKKDLILTAGYNVYPAEIERVIATHPAVALVAVGRVLDETRGELAKAYIVLAQGARATEAEIVEHCRQHLAAYKVPRLVAFVSDLPKTSTGKVMRRALAELDRRG